MNRAKRLIFALGVIALTACGREANRARTLPDAAPNAVARIVAIGGPVTETLYALGAGDRIVGVDTSSVYPDSATKLAHVGYQRTLSAEGILGLTPTLVIASNEAGPPAALEQLRSAGVRVEVVTVDPTLAGAKDRVIKVAALVDRDPAATLATLDAEVNRANAFVAKTTTRPKVLALYARGENTMFVFGSKTAADAMVKLAGGDNAVTGFEGSKPLTSEAVVAAAPEIILLPSRGLESIGGLEGLLNQPGVAQTPAGKSKFVITIDDLLLLGFGPRTGTAALELAEKIHPEIAAKEIR